MEPIRIEQTEVDGVGGTENCEHFSIRGFAAEIRKKDPKIGWPYSLFSDQTSDEPTGFKPLTVTKFRRWDCQNCLDKATNCATTTANEAPSNIQNAEVKKSTVSLRNIFKSFRASDKELLPGFHQLSEGEVEDKGLIQAVSSVNMTNGEGCPSADCGKDTDNYLITDAATEGLQVAKASQCSYEGIQNPLNDKPANVVTTGEACHMGGDRNALSTANILEAVCCEGMVNAKSKETEVANKCAEFRTVAGLAFINSGVCGEKDEQSVGEMGKTKEQCNKAARETEVPLGNNIGIPQVDSQTAVTTHFSELDSKESDESEDETSDNNITFPQEDTVKGRNAAKQLVISDGTLQHKRTRKVRWLDDIMRKERLHSFGKIHNSDGNEEANQIEDKIDRRLPASRKKDRYFGLEIYHTSPDKTKVKSFRGKRKYVDFENLEDQSALIYWIKKAREEAKTNKIYTEAKHIDAAADVSAENNLVDSLKVHGAKEHKQNAIACRMQSAVHQGCLMPQQENMAKKDIVIAGGKATKQVNAKKIHSKSKAAVKSKRSFPHGPETRSNTNEEVTLRKKKKVHLIDNKKSSQMHLPKGQKKVAQERETTQACEQDTSDDIPMDIVELLAKNQHERQLMDAKADMVNTHNLSERTGIMEDNHVLDVTKGHGDNVPGALHKNLSQQKSLWNNAGNSVWTAIRSDKNADESMKSDYATSHGSKSNRINLNQKEIINATIGFQSPLQYRSHPSLSTTEVCHSQHHSWSKLWTKTSESCQKGQGILGQNTFRNAQGELSMLLNRTPFGIDAEKVNAHYNYMNMVGRNTFLKEKPKTDALNVDYSKTMEQAKTHLQSREERGEFSTHNRSFPSVTSFAKIGNSGNSEMRRPQGLYTNETIPAMHLLRLMDSSKWSGTSLQDLPKRNYKGSLIESDFSSIVRCEKEMIGLAPWGSSHSTNHSFMIQQSSQVQHQEFSCKPHRPLPRVGVYGSLLQKEITSPPDNSGTFRIGYSSKMTYLEDNRKDNSELSYSANQAGIILNAQSPISRNENSGRPFSVVNLNSNVHSGWYSARNHTIGTEISSKGAAVQPLNNRREKEVCVVNRNPADFTIVDENNEYMIESDDTWHTVPTSNTQCICPPDGQGKKKARRVTASNGRMRS